MQQFILWVKMMGIGINDQVSLKIQLCMVCDDCACPEAALRSGTLHRWCRAQGFLCEPQRQVSVTNPAFPLSIS